MSTTNDSKPTGSRTVSKATRAAAARVFIEASKKSGQPVPQWVKNIANESAA